VAAHAVPPTRALCWDYPHYGNQGGAPVSALRRDDWKLIVWHEDDRAELYDLTRDPGETTDLALRHPDTVTALRAELQAWRREVGAVAPSPNPRHDPSQPDSRSGTPRQGAGP
jgi:arylsulfatase A-like enzyme